MFHFEWFQLLLWDMCWEWCNISYQSSLESSRNLISIRLTKLELLDSLLQENLHTLPLIMAENTRLTEWHSLKYSLCLLTSCNRIRCKDNIWRKTLIVRCHFLTYILCIKLIDSWDFLGHFAILISNCMCSTWTSSNVNNRCD